MRALAHGAVEIEPGWYEVALSGAIERDSWTDTDGNVFGFYRWTPAHEDDDTESHSGLQEEMYEGERRWFFYAGGFMNGPVDFAEGLDMLWRDPVYVDWEEPGVAVPVTVGPPFEAMRCDHCNRLWKLLGITYTQSAVNEVYAAHDCDGIGILATWERCDDGWTVRVIDTEAATVLSVFGEEEGVPPVPPVVGVPQETS